MMSIKEREAALVQMEGAIRRFHAEALHIGNAAFLEFAGVMIAYVKACEHAHRRGIDFSNCGGHAGPPLPMAALEIDALIEKLNAVFSGRIQAREVGT